MTDLRTIRVDQVGSLCAPPALQGVFAGYKQGSVSEDALDRAKDEAIRAIVSRQAAIGLPVVTDGELRRRNFQESFGSSVAGFEVAAEDRSHGAKAICTGLAGVLGELARIRELLEEIGRAHV